ncbi:MAG: hypothetical protein VR65_08170 [Desulfobulbaceae bacterium BRH_c16a]|nr:MAG: hypothetical protein VR65_08170 [Desulfobulbaceae bacterium BRH_c16a]
MQFCKDCGGVLNLFGINQGELCSACIQHKKKIDPPAPMVPREEVQAGLLADAVLSLENNKIVLRSKEGWELWSAQPGVQTALKTVLDRAGRIYGIRLRRQKN